MPNSRAIFANRKRIACHSFGISQIASKIKTTSPPTKTAGCVCATHKPPTTATSYATDAVQLVNGSGDVLISRREPALMAWVAADRTPPPMLATSISAVLASAKTVAARTAPAGT